MDAVVFNAAELANFTGSETWYRHSLVRNILYTEGAQYVAETAGAYWLLDELACAQLRPKIRREPFQTWTLTRNQTGNGAMLRCTDGNGRTVFAKRIEYTDFPMHTITLWLVDRTILLPSEY